MLTLIKMPCCCDLRGVNVTIFSVYAIINIAFLVGFVVIVQEPEHHIDNILEYIETHSEQLRDDILHNTVREILVRNTTEHFALPITITVVLLVANIISLWGCLFSLHLLVSQHNHQQFNQEHVLDITMVAALQCFHHLHHQSPHLLLGHPGECLDQSYHLPHCLPVHSDLSCLLYGSLLSV